MSGSMGPVNDARTLRPTVFSSAGLFWERFTP